MMASTYFWCLGPACWSYESQLFISNMEQALGQIIIPKISTFLMDLVFVPGRFGSLFTGSADCPPYTPLGCLVFESPSRCTLTRMERSLRVTGVGDRNLEVFWRSTSILIECGLVWKFFCCETDFSLLRFGRSRTEWRRKMRTTRSYWEARSETFPCLCIFKRYPSLSLCP